MSSQPLELFISFLSPDTKGLYFQAFGGRRRCLNKSVAPLLAHGYRRFLPTKDHVFILDYAGTLFFLKNALVSSTLGQIQWKRACRYVVLCRGAKDVSNRSLQLRTHSTSGDPVPAPNCLPITRTGKQVPVSQLCTQVSHLPPQPHPTPSLRSQTPLSFPTVCLRSKM